MSPFTRQIASPQDRFRQKRRKLTDPGKRPPNRLLFPGRLQVPEPEEPVASSSNDASSSDSASSSDEAEPTERRDTVMSIFSARSWSLWLQKEEASPSARDAEAARVLSGARLTFLERVRKDRVMHFLLALIFSVGLTLIIAGVIYEKTHGDIAAEERRRAL